MKKLVFLVGLALMLMFTSCLALDIGSCECEGNCVCGATSSD